MAVRAARTHLRTIGRQPTYFESFAHAHFDEELPEEQHALASEACDLDLDVFEAVGMFRFGSVGRSRLRSNAKHVGYGALGRLILLDRGRFRAVVAEDV